MTDWSLPNRPMLCQNIDRDTLKITGYIDTENIFYKPGKWILEN